METALDFGSVALGGVILYFGAEWLVKGAAGLARALGVKPLVIGLTVVAYGTSAPELATSAAAIMQNSSPMVLGNIIGSCVANLALILGITALIAPPSVDGRLIRREVPVMVASVFAIPLVLFDGVISLVEAIVLLGCAVAFTIFTLGAAASSRRKGESSHEGDEHDEESTDKRAWLVFLTVIGLAGLVGGGKLFVNGAIGLAEFFGVSDHLIGVTVVAIGTSLPELAASVMAAMRGYSGLAVGNVVGSNIFNVFLVLGGVGLIRPIRGALETLRFDILFLIGVTVLGVLSMRGTRRISRTEGILLLVAYATFVITAVIRR